MKVKPSEDKSQWRVIGATFQNANYKNREWKNPEENK